MLVQLVNQGLVQLNTPIDKLLDSKVRDNPITLLNLATHSSGFPRRLPSLPNTGDYQINQPYEMADFLSWYESYTPKHKPGTHYEYSNVAYGLLGQLLAKKMNMSYGSLLQQLITKPLDLKDTTVTLTDDQAKRRVTSYWTNGDLIKKDWVFHFEQPSGGVYSTMTDLLRFTNYQLGHNPGAVQNTRLAHASYIYQNQFDNPFAFGNDAMALGWIVVFPAQGLPLQLVKNGWVDGVNTYIQLAPSEDIGLVSFTNKPYLNITTDLQKLIGMILGARAKAATS